MPFPEQRERLLDRFWEELPKCSNSWDVLALLRRFADVLVGTHEMNRIRAYKLRRQFDLVKVTQQLATCVVCAQPAEHRHHIITLANGGENDLRNIVQPCAGCHRDIHPT